MQSILPEEWRQPQHIPEIIKEYKRLTGIPPSDACFRYVEAIRKLPSYGDTFFQIEVDHEDVLSINSNGICHFEGESWRLLSEWFLADLRFCHVDSKGEILTIEFSDGAAFSCSSREALAEERLIMDYLDFEAKKKAKPQQQKSDETCVVM